MCQVKCVAGIYKMACVWEDIACTFAMISLDSQLICSVIGNYSDLDATTIIWNGTTAVTLTTLKVHHPYWFDPYHPRNHESKFLLAAFFLGGARIVTFACHALVFTVGSHCVSHEITVWSCNSGKSLSNIIVHTTIKPDKLAVSPDMKQVYFQLCSCMGSGQWLSPHHSLRMSRWLATSRLILGQSWFKWNLTPTHK